MRREWPSALWVRGSVCFLVTLRSGLVAKVLSRTTSQNVRRGRCPLWPFRYAPVLVLLQPASPRFLVAAAAAVVAATAAAVVAATVATAATAVVAPAAAAAAANQEDQDDDPPAAPTETIVTTTHDLVTSLRFSRSRRPARTPHPLRRRSRAPCVRFWVILCSGREA